MKKSNEPTKMNETIMKKTMNYLSMAALALVGIVMTGCSSEDNIASNQQPVKQDNIVTVTTTIGLGGDNATTRALNIDYVAKTLTKTFAVGDQVALIYYNTSNEPVKAVSNALKASDITNDGKSANFTFTLTNPQENGWAVYKYPASFIGANGYMDQTKFQTQGGTLAYVSSIDLAQGSGEMVGTTLPASVTLENAHAIIAFTLKDAAGTDITSTITGMTIATQYNSYNITGHDTDGHIYVAIAADKSSTLNITATDGSHSYTKSISGGNKYQANNFYQQGLKMPYYTLSNSTVGMIVGSDGKAYDVTDKDKLPEGVTAVAMVAYKNGANGLAIQLNSSPSKMYWSDANAYTDYPTISGNVGTWRLPSDEDWINMFTGCGINGDGLQSNNPNPDPLYFISGFVEKINATGATWTNGNYWSSTTTGTGSDTKYGYVFTNSSDSPTNHYYAYIHKMLKENADNQSVQLYVLGCFAF